jgi:hypothetical protein
LKITRATCDHCNCGQHHNPELEDHARDLRHRACDGFSKHSRRSARMTSRWRTGLALLWLALRVVAGGAVSQRLEMSGDLRKFMPAQDMDRRAVMPDARAACAIWSAAACAAVVEG